jgi:hypothetical protein
VPNHWLRLRGQQFIAMRTKSGLQPFAHFLKRFEANKQVANETVGSVAWSTSIAMRQSAREGLQDDSRDSGTVERHG